MAVITTKELGSIEDQLHLEENLVKKYHTYAAETNDSILKDRYEMMAQRHQRHFDELYANLK